MTHNLAAEWVNAISVVVLVGVTAYYAWTSNKILKESEKTRKAAEKQAASAESQASTAMATLHELRQQNEELRGLGNSVVRTAIDRAVRSIERWKKLEIKQNFVNAHTFPSPDDLIPDNAQSAVEHARKVSEHCVALLIESFDDLRSARDQIEILKHGSDPLVQSHGFFNAGKYDPGPFLTSAFARLQQARKLVS